MAAADVFDRYPLLAPPRFTGNQTADAIALLNWADAFYRTLVNILGEEIIPRIEALEAATTRISALENLDSSATLAETIAKVNEIIAAAALSQDGG